MKIKYYVFVIALSVFVMLALVGRSSASPEIKLYGVVSSMTHTGSASCTYRDESIVNIKCSYYDVQLKSGDQAYSLFLSPTMPIQAGQGNSILPGQLEELVSHKQDKNENKEDKVEK